MFYLLRELGGHGHLRLRTHVSVLYLWHQAEEDVQRLLSNLQKANQRHNQDLSEHIREKQCVISANKIAVSRENKCHIYGYVNVGNLLKLPIKSPEYHFSEVDATSFRRSVPL